MVKKMDDYINRTNDKRFEKYDKMIAPDSSGKKQTIILSIGLAILLIIMGYNTFADMNKPAPPKFDYGLNISYSPESSIYFIDYTNPNQTALEMNVNIDVPYFNTGTSGYSSVYKTSTKEFPANISYIPYDKALEHVLTITLVKPMGNYTYYYSNNPGDDERIYNGLTKYVDVAKTMV
jgi:hypothetical protein